MEVKYLLEDSEHFKIIMLSYLEINKNNFVTMSKLIEFVGLSRYKTEMYLDQLQKDLLIFDPSSILIDNDEEIFLKNISYSTVKNLRGTYFRKSYPLKLLTTILVKPISINQFAVQEHISQSTAYDKRKKLIKFLKTEKIHIKKNLIHGNEKKLRNVLFYIYFESMGGMKYPFPNSTQIITQKIINFLKFSFNLKLTKTSLNKLELLLSIALLRINSYNYLDSVIFDENSYLSNQNVYKFIDYLDIILEKKHTKKSLCIESSYILLYLILEGEIDSTLLNYYDYSIFKPFDNFSKEITEGIFNSIDFINTGKDENIYKIKESFYHEIKLVNRKYSLFNYEMSAFTSTEQISFFLEAYPLFSKAIQENIQITLDRYNIFNDTIKTRLFYDYIFILIKCCPLQYVEKSIKIFVDFSQGTYYNDYIINQILGFKNFNIEIEPRFSSKTNIYISDCLSDDKNITHILWKKPPTPEDWEELGNAIVSINLKNYQQ